MSRSLNQTQLIGNLTRAPELKKTPSGVSVCTFAVATNRDWVTDNGEKKQDTQYHKIVAWHKLADLCEKLLIKGSKVYVQGRIEHHEFEADGQKRNTTEIIIDDMIILDSIKKGGEENNGRNINTTST